MHIPGYKILRTIGEGGTATAYLAIRKRNGNYVVLKIFRGLSGGGPEETIGHDTLTTAQRFTNEANLIASLKHPYIVRIYEWGEVKGFHFIAMEYLDGGDLEARI
ncbi:MAG: hypothetical protein GY731_06450, partial [Gammaproteobacteria bacterium]|nr:hypothetical protein [Gammaproteobacteria bacterium]